MSERDRDCNEKHIYNNDMVNLSFGDSHICFHVRYGNPCQLPRQSHAIVLSNWMHVLIPCSLARL